MRNEWELRPCLISTPCLISLDTGNNTLSTPNTANGGPVSNQCRTDICKVEAALNQRWTLTWFHVGTDRWRYRVKIRFTNSTLPPWSTRLDETISRPLGDLETITNINLLLYLSVHPFTSYIIGVTSRNIEWAYPNKMLGQRRRRPNLTPALGECLVFFGILLDKPFQYTNVSWQPVLLFCLLVFSFIYLLFYSFIYSFIHSLIWNQNFI